MDRKEALEVMKPFMDKAGIEVPENLEDLSIEQLIELITTMAKDPYHLDGLSRDELEDLLEQTEEEISELEAKMEAIEERLENLD